MRDNRVVPSSNIMTELYIPYGEWEFINIVYYAENKYILTYTPAPPPPPPHFMLH